MSLGVVLDGSSYGLSIWTKNLSTFVHDYVVDLLEDHIFSRATSRSLFCGLS